MKTDERLAALEAAKKELYEADRLLRLHIERVEAATGRLDRFLQDTRSKMRYAANESY